MTALSPLLSWLIVGGWLLLVVLYVAFFMGATRAPREHRGVDVLPWVDVRPEDAPPSAGLPPAVTYNESADVHVRIIVGPYDHDARGDFE